MNFWNKFLVDFGGMVSWGSGPFEENLGSKLGGVSQGHRGMVVLGFGPLFLVICHLLLLLTFLFLS